MAGRAGARPTRGRLTEAARAALAPVAACALALGGLAAWTASGAAGSPARIEVSAGRMYLPFGGSRESAAFFRVANSGGDHDQLTGVTSPAASGVMLGRNTATDGNAATMRGAGPVTVAAGGTLEMSPRGLDVMLTLREPVRAGDRVPFVLHFRRSGPVRVSAVVVRPGAG
ncbi:copper chaperone PCu(A)C [Streptomyces alfalfae]